MAQTKKDEPLLEKDAANDFFDSIKRNGALIFAIVFFMICSSGMLLVNKAVLLTWDLPITVTIFQMAFCSLYLLATDPITKQLRVGSWADARRCAHTLASQTDTHTHTHTKQQRRVAERHPARAGSQVVAVGADALRGDARDVDAGAQLLEHGRRRRDAQHRTDRHAGARGCHEGEGRR